MELLFMGKSGKKTGLNHIITRRLVIASPKVPKIQIAMDSHMEVLECKDSKMKYE